jgi:predicted hydrocarbon binding protein
MTGPSGLRALHASLLGHAPEQTVTVLQESGYGAGADVYQAFENWLPRSTGFAKPGDIDAAQLSEVVSRFFEHAGWGDLSVTSIGGGTLALDSAVWAEAEPATAEQPMCFYSAGMLAEFFGRLSGEPVAVMEVECRSRNDARCRFLTAVPERLQKVYEALTQGKSYEEALQAADS